MDLGDRGGQSGQSRHGLSETLQRFLTLPYPSPLPLTPPHSPSLALARCSRPGASCTLPLTPAPAPLCPPKRPSTPARFVWTFTSPGLGQTLYGAFFFMWPFNRIIVRRTQYLSRCLEARLPSGDLTSADGVPAESISVPTQGMTDIHSPEPVYGEEIEYAETWQKGSYLSALLFSLAQVVFFGVFFGSKLVSPLSRSASVCLHRRGRSLWRIPRSKGIYQHAGSCSRLSAA
jgi:hypothetical protein